MCKSQTVATPERPAVVKNIAESSETFQNDVCVGGTKGGKDVSKKAPHYLQEGRPSPPKGDCYSRSTGKSDESEKNRSCTQVKSVLTHEFQHEVCMHFPFKRYLEPEYRGIKVSQLEIALKYAIDNCHKWKEVVPDSQPAIVNTAQPVSMNSLSMCTFNEWVVLPATAQQDCSFVELIAECEQRSQWFVSYWDGDRMRAFFRCISQHMNLRGLPKETSHWWISAYAMRQHSKPTSDAIDYAKSSFFKAMSRARGILLVLDSRLDESGPATPLKRLWNVFEVAFSLPVRTKMRIENERLHCESLMLDIATAFKGDVHFITDGSTEADSQRGSEFAVQEKAAREARFPEDVLKEGLAFQLEVAHASHDIQRQSILNALVGRCSEFDPKAYSDINSIVRGIFACAGWRRAIETQSVHEWDLARTMASDVCRKSLVLDFSFCVQLNSDDLETLARSFPLSLVKLHLGFRSCSMLDDACLIAIASKLPPLLLELRLSVQGCKKVRSDGVMALASRLPSGLQILDLCFQFCENVGEIAVAAFVKSSGAQCHELALDFRGTVANVFIKSVEELRAWTPIAPPGQPKDGSQLRPGLAVRVRGLERSKEINGQQGIVERWDFMAERWVVCMRSGSHKSFKADNLQSASLDLQPGLDVIIYGMVVALELEGEMAKCSHWDASTARWHVRLRNGEVKAMKPENLKPA